MARRATINPGEPRASAEASGLPTRAQILDLVRQGGNVGKREIARAFNVKGAKRTALKRMLRDMVEDGALARGRNRRLADPDKLPTVLVAEITAIDGGGDPIASPAPWRGDGPPPRITLPADANRRAPALGIGDRALIRIRDSAAGTYEGRVIRALEAAHGPVVGLYRRGRAGGRIRPADRRMRSELHVAEDDSNGAADGELVVAEMTRARAFGLSRARIVERLGRPEAPCAIGRLVCATHDIPVDFPAAALAQADTARAPTRRGRVDLRALELVTIDDDDARDFDDAVWAEPDPDPGNAGGWHIVVAIADVAHYVRPGDAIDREAGRRGNSVYLPDMVAPMLPEPLANRWCSLIPGADRACLAAHIWLDRNGNRLRQRFERALMRSAARLTYAAVQSARDGRPDRATEPLAERIDALYRAYAVLKRARAARDTLDFDLPERRVLLAEDGAVEAIRPRPRYDSHRLIEELMIAANVAVAETLAAKGSPCLYRIHDQPPLDKLEALRAYLGSLGYRLGRGRRLTPASFKRILEKAAGSKDSELVAMAILRAQAQAEYSPDNIGHFGLNLHRYAHFTSPIRRYGDLLVHRSLIRLLQMGPGGLADGAAQRFGEIGAAISATERRAATAERDALDRYAARFLSERIGATFAARIVGVTRAGLFVALDEVGAEGLVPIRALGEQIGDYLNHDRDRRRLVGRATGLTFSLGAPLTVRLAEADALTGRLNFTLVAPADAAVPAQPRAAR